MNTAAKVMLGVSAVVGSVIAVTYVSRKRRPELLGRTQVVPNVSKPRPVREVKGRAGTVKQYRKGKLPIRERLAIIQDLIAKGVSGEDLPIMRKLALQITSGCAARDDKCEARAIYDWVRRNVRYTGDIAPHKINGRHGPVESVDLFQSAKQTAEFQGGDCDDHTTLVSTLAILNGIPARLRVTSPYKWGEDNYTHIYPVLGLPKNDPSKWVAADTTLPGDRFGVQVPYAKGLDVVA